MTYADEFVAQIAVEVAKILSKDFKIDENRVAAMVAEILASNYRYTSPGQSSKHGVYRKAENQAQEIISKMIAEETLSA